MANKSGSPNKRSRIAKGKRKNVRAVRKDTKIVILNSAIDLFSQKGYSNTTMREIALEAKIKPGSIYNHYVSKQNILESILEVYDEYIVSTVLTSEAYAKLENADSVDHIMSIMSTTYPEEEAPRLLKMLYIILHEQFRIDEVKRYIIDKIILANETYVKGLLDYLMKRDLIEPVDSNAIAKLHVGTIYYWMGINLFGLDHEQDYIENHTMDSIIRFIYEKIIVFKNAKK